LIDLDIINKHSMRLSISIRRKPGSLTKETGTKVIIIAGESNKATVMD